MIRRALVGLVLLGLVASCERKRTLVPLESKSSASQVRLEPIAQLVVNRTTHVAVDAVGNIYWTQESDDGQDLLFVVGPSGNLPQPTTLSSSSILAAMNVKSASPGASGKPSKSKPGGNIQSLVTGLDGGLYFYFSGGAGANSAQALGRYDARSGEIQIVADTQQLATISDMGHSLDLARGKLLACGSVIRLFLRHSDNWAILEFEPNRLPVIGQGHLERKIPMVRINEPVDLTSSEIDLCVGPVIAGSDASRQSVRHAILMIDRRMGAIHVVDESGASTFLASIVGISDTLSEPTAQARQKNADRPQSDRPEQFLIFAADSTKIDPPLSARPEPPSLLVQYPALLTLDAATGKYTAISRDEIQGPGEFAVYAVRLQQLIPLTRDTFAGYDASSGQLLRVHLKG